MTIKDERIKDLQWKPLFFLARRDQAVRIRTRVDWDHLVEVCTSAGEKYANQLAFHFPKSDQAKNPSSKENVPSIPFDIFAKSLRAYGLAILEGKSKSMERPLACKQVARILYCLARSRRFNLIDQTKEGFILDLTKNLSREHSVPATILSNFFDSSRWTDSDKNVDEPRNDLNLLKKFRSDCRNDFRVAKSLIEGDGWGS